MALYAMLELWGWTCHAQMPSLIAEAKLAYCGVRTTVTDGLTVLQIGPALRQARAVGS